jgi:hypothetical protein
MNNVSSLPVSRNARIAEGPAPSAYPQNSSVHAANATSRSREKSWSRFLAALMQSLSAWGT